MDNRDISFYGCVYMRPCKDNVVINNVIKCKYKITAIKQYKNSNKSDEIVLID